MPASMSLTKEQHDYVCKTYRQGVSGYAIAEVCNVSPRTIYRVLQRRGISRRPAWVQASNIDVRHDCFAKIDDEDSAYWLGFLYADGYIHSYPAYISINLKDKEHLEKFRSFVRGGQKILEMWNTSPSSNRKHRIYRYSLGSQRIVRDLEHWGCVQCKSELIRFPDFLEESLVRHFVRGFFDGDGCLLSHLPNGAVTEQWILRISGNLNFLQSLQSQLMLNCSVSKTKLAVDKRTLPTFRTLAYCGNRQVPRIIHWMYNDVTLYLDRKYKIVQKCLGGS